MKKTVKVIAVTSLSITLIGCLAFIYILLRTNIIFKNQTVADAGIKDNIKLEDVSKITVTYKEIRLLRAEDFQRRTSLLKLPKTTAEK